MYFNLIQSYRNVIAVADEELIGKKFSEDKKELFIKESFYKGKKREEKEIIEEMIFWKQEDATFNIIGKKSTEAGLKAGIIVKESIGIIDGIPFALVLI